MDYFCAKTIKTHISIINAKPYWSNIHNQYPKIFNYVYHKYLLF